MRKRGTLILCIAIIIVLIACSGVFAKNSASSEKPTKEIRVENRGEGGKIRSSLEVGGVAAESEVEIETEENETEVRVRATLSNGNKQEIKIMPNTASERAIEVLGSKNITIQLKEVGKTGETELVYEVEANKTGKFLGIFKTKIKLKAQVSAENGTILRLKKPWWSFLVSGEEDFELGDKVTLCHVPPGNPENAHEITIGSPAVRAHLKHGDYLGECKGKEPEPTPTPTPTPAPEEKLLEILSPENITYTTNDVVINISSNGDTILFSINNNANQTYTASIIKTFENGTNILTAFALFTVQVNETITTINETTNETITTINTTTITEILTKSVVFIVEPANETNQTSCIQEGEPCGGIAGLICCGSLGCNYTENIGMPNASGVCAINESII